MKAPQVIYLCLTTAFWIVGSLMLASVVSDGDAKGGGVVLITIIVLVNLGLLKWGGFFRNRDDA